MTNHLGIDFAADLGQAIADLPSVLLIGGNRYFVAADDEARSQEVAEESTTAIYDRRVTGCLSRFRAVPAIRSTCTLDNVKYYVADVTRNIDTDTLYLTLRREDA